jgi:hypothetical protein
MVALPGAGVGGGGVVLAVCWMGAGGCLAVEFITDTAGELVMVARAGAMSVTGPKGPWGAASRPGCISTVTGSVIWNLATGALGSREGEVIVT